MAIDNQLSDLVLNVLCKGSTFTTKNPESP